jgi:hypothetical protein
MDLKCQSAKEEGERKDSAPNQVIGRYGKYDAFIGSG